MQYNITQQCSVRWQKSVLHNIRRSTSTTLNRKNDQNSRYYTGWPQFFAKKFKDFRWPFPDLFQHCFTILDDVYGIISKRLTAKVWYYQAQWHSKCCFSWIFGTHTFNGPLSGIRPTWVSRYQKGKKTIWILLKQETVSGSSISWAICKSAPCSRQITTTPPHHSVFYRPDALPGAQPTVSKHRRH